MTPRFAAGGCFPALPAAYPVARRAALQRAARPSDPGQLTMKCLICGRKIAAKETRTYTTVKAPSGRERKVYACTEHQTAFDKWIDSRAIDSDGNLLEQSA